MAKGFRDLPGGVSTVAPLILPDSDTANYAIDQIARAGLLNQAQQVAAAKNTAQTNKNFATNAIKLKPGLHYQNELSGLAQKWFNKGVQYRKQGFDPWNPDYNNNEQVKASQEYLNERQQIDDLANFRDVLDKDFAEKQKLAMTGKVEGFDEYQKTIQNTPLLDLYNKGGINALPEVNEPLDLGGFDKSYQVQPRTREVEKEIQPGVFQRTTEKYIPVQDVAKTYEQLMVNTPAYVRKLNKAGINPDELFTRNGFNMIKDRNNPESFGQIDEPAIYQQLAEGYLTDPNRIKELPSSVKKKIMDDAVGNFNAGAGGVLNADQSVNGIMNRYQPSEDPEFKDFLSKKFDEQIKKERAYQTEILNGVMRKASSVPTGETSKIDDTMAQLAMSRQRLQLGWANNRISQRNSDRADKQLAARTKDASTRKQFVDDIQNMNDDAVKTFEAGLSEIGARLKRTKSGITISVPDMTPQLDKKGVTTGQKEKIYINYKIGKFSGRSGRTMIEQLLNKLPTFGKEKALETEPYSPTYDDIGASDTADDL